MKKSKMGTIAYAWQDPALVTTLPADPVSAGNRTTGLRAGPKWRC
jgi:hypothetical protein